MNSLFGAFLLFALFAFFVIAAIRWASPRRIIGAAVAAVALYLGGHSLVLAQASSGPPDWYYFDRETTTFKKSVPWYQDADGDGVPERFRWMRQNYAPQTECEGDTCTGWVQVPDAEKP